MAVAVRKKQHGVLRVKLCTKNLQPWDRGLCNRTGNEDSSILGSNEVCDRNSLSKSRWPSMMGPSPCIGNQHLW